MAAETAQVLSSKQKQKSISAKTRRPTVKAVLCTPYAVKWPSVSPETTSTVLNQLTSVLSSVELRNVCHVLRHDKPLEFKKFSRLKAIVRREKIKEMYQGRSEKERNSRGQLVLGFNAVTKALDRDSLRLVIACRDSWSLVKHLAQQVAHQGCAGMALSGLGEALKVMLGISKLSVIGFKKTKPEDCDTFDDLVNKVSALCSPIDVPWGDLEQELLSIKCNNTEPAAGKPEPLPITPSNTADGKPDIEAESSESSDSDDEEEAEEKELKKSGVKIGKTAEEKPTDYSHLYVYKSQVAPRLPVRFRDEGVTYIQPKAEGLEQMDFVAIGQDIDEESDVVTESRKRKSSEQGPSRSSKKRKNKHKKEFKPMVLGKVQANSNRINTKNKSHKLYC